MVKVFRKFRWNQLADGKVGRYLLYALGEILLVVIGILIALSIDNANKKKELRVAEKKVYSNLFKKIQEDRHDLVGNVYYNDSHMRDFQKAYDIIDSQNRQEIDTLAVNLLKLFEYSNFSASDNIYQNLVNSGDLKLLHNDSIIDGVQELEELYIYLNRMETNHWDVILRFVGPGIIDNIHVSDFRVERPDELYSFQMQNLVFALMGIMQEKDSLYNSTMVQIDQISDLINRELEKD